MRVLVLSGCLVEVLAECVYVVLDVTVWYGLETVEE